MRVRVNAPGHDQPAGGVDDLSVTTGGDTDFTLVVVNTGTAIAVIIAAMMWAVGVKPFLLVHLPITLLAVPAAASVGERRAHTKRIT